MRKIKIYTKSGDKGKTSLVNGKRISKNDDRIDLYGEVDELNSYLGLVLASFNEKKNSTKFFKDEINYLTQMQSTMFNIGSYLACESSHREKFKIPKISHEQIREMEKIIDKIELELTPLRNFVLPGGSTLSSLIHILRTKTRKIERKIISFKLKNNNEIDDNLIIYFNRLSDYFFVLSRFVNKKLKISEILWINK